MLYSIFPRQIYPSSICSSQHAALFTPDDHSSRYESRSGHGSTYALNVELGATTSKQAWSVVGGTAMEIVISRNTNLACSRHRLLPAVTLEVIQSEYTCHGTALLITMQTL